ncbi:hypothetical protein, partial [Ralstonia pseudosolanacearum]|uniref:hypothetical protein n=1 Tax=Ralstonia pseudosolanacearum TaxID=1310165 RepID=UPI001FFB134D
MLFHFAHQPTRVNVKGRVSVAIGHPSPQNNPVRSDCHTQISGKGLGAGGNNPIQASRLGSARQEGELLQSPGYWVGSIELGIGGIHLSVLAKPPRRPISRTKIPANIESASMFLKLSLRIAVSFVVMDYGNR